MKFIPSVQDYLENMTLEPWMQNGMGIPNSAKLLKSKYDNDIFNEDEQHEPKLSDKEIKDQVNEIIKQYTDKANTNNPRPFNEYTVVD